MSGKGSNESPGIIDPRREALGFFPALGVTAAGTNSPDKQFKRNRKDQQSYAGGTTSENPDKSSVTRGVPVKAALSRGQTDLCGSHGGAAPGAPRDQPRGLTVSASGGSVL